MRIHEKEYVTIPKVILNLKLASLYAYNTRTEQPSFKKDIKNKTDFFNLIQGDVEDFKSYGLNFAELHFNIPKFSKNNSITLKSMYGCILDLCNHTGGSSTYGFKSNIWFDLDLRKGNDVKEQTTLVEQLLRSYKEREDYYGGVNLIVDSRVEPETLQIVEKFLVTKTLKSKLERGLSFEFDVKDVLDLNEKQIGEQIKSWLLFLKSFCQRKRLHISWETNTLIDDFEKIFSEGLSYHLENFDIPVTLSPYYQYQEEKNIKIHDTFESKRNYGMTLDHVQSMLGKKAIPFSWGHYVNNNYSYKNVMSDVYHDGVARQRSVESLQAVHLRDLYNRHLKHL